MTKALAEYKFCKNSLGWKLNYNENSLTKHISGIWAYWFEQHSLHQIVFDILRIFSFCHGKRLFQLLDSESGRKRLLQLLRLFAILDYQSVKVAAASDLDAKEGVGGCQEVKSEHFVPASRLNVVEVTYNT